MRYDEYAGYEYPFIKEIYKMKKVLLSLSFVILLGACSASVHPNHTRIYSPVGSVKIKEGHGGERHCPPGHAKKGWC
jgi:hypothetical protein